AVGGGVRTVADAEALLRAGADKVSLNTAALADPALLTGVARLTGSQSALVAIDAKRRPDGSYEVYSHGGTRPTGRDAVACARGAASPCAGRWRTSHDPSRRADLRRARPGAVHRPGRGDRRGADARLAIARRACADPHDRQGDLLEPIAQRAVGEGRDER